jgi:hypothetical protein
VWAIPRSGKLLAFAQDFLQVLFIVWIQTGMIDLTFIWLQGSESWPILFNDGESTFWPQDANRNLQIYCFVALLPLTVKDENNLPSKSTICGFGYPQKNMLT